jgi:hypothetical protein
MALLGSVAESVRLVLTDYLLSGTKNLNLVSFSFIFFYFLLFSFIFFSFRAPRPD